MRVNSNKDTIPPGTHLPLPPPLTLDSLSSQPATVELGVYLDSLTHVHLAVERALVTETAAATATSNQPNNRV